MATKNPPQLTPEEAAKELQQPTDRKGVDTTKGSTSDGRQP
jgi:hypothetical protein